jgi:hypothetical protein
MIDLDDRAAWTIRLSGRLSNSIRLLATGRCGDTRALCPVPARRWSFLHFVVSTAGYLPTVSLLVIQPVFPLWRALVVVVESWWPLLNSVSQLLVLAGHLPSEVLDVGCNNLHLPFDRGHRRISIGSVIMGSLHNRD